MDKFDQVIQEAADHYEPTKNFVEATMSKINNRQRRKFGRLKLWAPVLAGGLAVIAVAFVALPIGSHDQSKKTAAQPRAASSLSQKPGSPATASAIPAPAPGSDNATLDSDLNGINSAINQESGDQTAADSALNDSQQQIAVPTT